jgi:uncharacterized protein (DUF58 family)
MRTWLQTLQRGVRYRVTRGGFLFTMAVALVGAAAAASANNLLFLVVATMLSVLLISGLVSRLGLAGLELDFALPEHVSVGRAVAATLAVRNMKLWMPSFSVHVAGVAEEPADGTPPILTSAIYFPIIPGRATLQENVDVRFFRRGAHRQNSFSFSTRFPFGFLEKTAAVTLRRDVVVYPSIDPKPGFEELLSEISGDLDAHHRGRGHEFYRIRAYEPFESARYVDWKATAHTGDLQVREFAREQERSVEIYLDRDIQPGAEAWFEEAVDCCAFLAWRLFQQGAGIRFQAQDFQVRVPEEADVYTILKYLALVYPIHGNPPEPPIDEQSFQIVFSPDPSILEAAGWTPARVLRPGDPALSADRSSADSPTS